MTHEDEISIWLSGLGRGDERAFQEVWNRYFDKLTRYARRKLDGAPRRAADEEDVALSAMHSFCRGAQAGRFPQLDDRDDLWKLLVTITARKISSLRRHETAQKRGGGAVRGESVFLGPADASRVVGIGDVLGAEPSPELADAVVDDCRHLLDALPDDTLRQIALWTLEGYTTSEIAERLGCVRRTVERKLERIRKIWTEDGLDQATS